MWACLCCWLLLGCGEASYCQQQGLASAGALVLVISCVQVLLLLLLLLLVSAVCKQAVTAGGGGASVAVHCCASCSLCGCQQQVQGQQ
jgi:hypothetical protein